MSSSEALGKLADSVRVVVLRDKPPRPGDATAWERFTVLHELAHICQDGATSTQHHRRERLVDFEHVDIPDLLADAAFRLSAALKQFGEKRYEES
jgi:hypothetical protein